MLHIHKLMADIQHDIDKGEAMVQKLSTEVQQKQQAIFQNNSFLTGLRAKLDMLKEVEQKGKELFEHLPEEALPENEPVSKK